MDNKELTVKIISDSSANLKKLDGADYTSVPMKVRSDREYIDDDSLDVSRMIAELEEYKGKSGSSCPSIGDWTSAFGNADIVYAAVITSKLSGAYNSACVAAEDYMDENPGKRVFVLDSLSTGPELELIVEKLAELTNSGRDFDEVTKEITEYNKKHTHLMFSLESLSNFAKNGRINPAIAAAASFLGIRIVGRASDQGDLEPLNKSRGEKKAIAQLYKNMISAGYNGGKVRISHTCNLEAANKLYEMIKESYPDCDMTIRENLGLCSYYAEKGGIIVGFER